LLRQIIETDAPWCGIKQTHPGHKYIETVYPSLKRDKFKMGVMVKDRSEPCMITQVFEVLAAIRGEEDKEAFAEALFENSENLFFRNHDTTV
jgi:TatD DNase family protein